MTEPETVVVADREALREQIVEALKTANLVGNWASWEELAESMMLIVDGLLTNKLATVEKLPPFELKLAIADPQTLCEADEDGVPYLGQNSVGWDMSFGCRLNFNQVAGGLEFLLSISDWTQKRGVERRTVTPEQVRSFAEQLLALLPEGSSGVQSEVDSEPAEVEPGDRVHFEWNDWAGIGTVVKASALILQGGTKVAVRSDDDELYVVNKSTVRPVSSVRDKAAEVSSEIASEFMDAMSKRRGVRDTAEPVDELTDDSSTPASPRVWRHGATGNPPFISGHEASRTGARLRNERGITWYWAEGGWRRRPRTPKQRERYISGGWGFWRLVEKYGPLTEVLPPVEVPSAETGEAGQ